MDWLNQIGGVLQQYAGNDAPPAAPDAAQHFEQVAQHAPSSLLSDGLAALFNSNQTPPFAQLVAQLFNHSNGSQRAGLLNTLLAAIGPALFSQILNRQGHTGLAGLLDGGATEISPDQAAQVSPAAVQEVAEQAETQNPSIVNEVSDLFSQHPSVVQNLGSSALSAILSGMANR